MKRMGENVYVGLTPRHQLAVHPNEAVTVMIGLGGGHANDPMVFVQALARVPLIRSRNSRAYRAKVRWEAT